MNFAYLILCHKNAPQVQRLIDRLNEPTTTFVLHVSTTCEPGFLADIRQRLSSYPNVHFCQREDGTHNGFGIVKGILNGLRYLLRHHIPFDYVSLLSGQDYPVKSPDDIRAFFEAHNGKQFLEYFPLYADRPNELTPDHPWKAHRQLYRVNRFHLKIDGAIRSIPELETGRLIDKPLYQTLKIFLYESPSYWRKHTWWREFQLLLLSRLLPKRRALPTQFELYGGKTWWSFTKDAVEYILDTVKHHREFVRFFRFTLIPDEMFFQTILMNSKFKADCENQSLRFVTWDKSDGLHPVFLTEEHLPALLQNHRYLFARKFDTAINGSLMDALDTLPYRHAQS